MASLVGDCREECELFIPVSEVCRESDLVYTKTKVCVSAIVEEPTAKSALYQKVCNFNMTFI